MSEPLPAPSSLSPSVGVQPVSCSGFLPCPLLSPLCDFSLVLPSLSPLILLCFQLFLGACFPEDPTTTQPWVTPRGGLHQHPPHPILPGWLLSSCPWVLELSLPLGTLGLGLQAACSVHVSSLTHALGVGASRMLPRFTADESSRPRYPRLCSGVNEEGSLRGGFG